MSALAEPIQMFQYITDEQGERTAVIVPISLWRELFPEPQSETERILTNPVMRERILNGMKRDEGIPYEVVREKLGI